MLTSLQRIQILFWCGVLLVLSMLAPIFFHIDVLTASNISSNGHFPREIKSAPLHFETDSFGRKNAFTAGGNQLLQSPIIDDEQTYLHRIDVDGAFFYVSDRGIISANSDTVAISIYHGMAA